MPQQDLTAAPAGADQPAPEPAPYEPPRRPYADPQGEAVLAIYAHGSLIGEMTRAERLCYRVIALAVSLTALLTEFLRRRWDESEETFLDLQLLARRLLQQTRAVLFPFIDRMDPVIDSARAADLEDADEPIDVLLEWVLHDNYDPLHEPDSNFSERLLWTVLGQLPVLHQDLGELTTLREQGGEQSALDLRLLRRLGELFAPLRHLVMKTSAQLSKGAHTAYLSEQAEAEHAAAIEAVRGPRQSRIIVVGAETLPPAHGIIGKTMDDRPVAWSLWEPSLTFLLGDRGKGKSHFIRVLMETMTLRPQGLATLKRPQCPILIDADSRQGEGRFEMLEGFFSNRQAAQLHHLHEFYQTDARNLAYKRAYLLCHRKQVADYQQTLAPYVERGLVIAPLALGMADLGGFAFEVMLEWAVGGDKNAVYKNMIQSLVARYGDELTLDLLRDKVQRADMRGNTRATVMELLDLLGGMYTQTESVMQYVGEDPVFTVLRGRYLPSNFVNPMQAVLCNAFCRSASHGDPPRTVFFEEYAKAMGQNRAMRRFAMNFHEEMRHRPVSKMAGMQHLNELEKGLWGAADNHVVFGISDPLDVEAAKQELYEMRGRRFEQYSAHMVPKGRAWIFGRRGSDPQVAQGMLVDIRPTLIRAGGETLNAGDSEDEED